MDLKDQIYHYLRANLDITHLALFKNSPLPQDKFGVCCTVARTLPL